MASSRHGRPGDTGEQPRHEGQYPPPWTQERTNPPEPPAKPKSKRRWVIVGSIAAAIIVLSIAAANTTPEGTQSTAPAVSPVPAAPASAEPPPSVPAGPATEIKDGVYQVGQDMAPGRYKTEGPGTTSFAPFCYYQRAKDDSAELTSIIANNNLQGPGSVTVKDGEFFTATGGCTWTKQ